MRTSEVPDRRPKRAAVALLETRGTAPRLYRNTLVFLAPDQSRLQDLEEAVRRHLAWESILAERDDLNLSAHQARQAETQRKAADDAVTARLPETYQWLLTPVQATPADPVTWEATRLSAQGELAVRAARRLKGDDLLATTFAGTRLRMELDGVPLWRADHVPVRKLVEDFAQYLYLPRLQDPGVLLRAAADGVGLMTWRSDSFAYADSFDEENGRYVGLRGGQVINDLDDVNAPGLLVKPEVASRQLDAERVEPAPTSPPGGSGNDGVGPDPDRPTPEPEVPPDPRPTRFHGTVELDATFAGRDAGPDRGGGDCAPRRPRGRERDGDSGSPRRDPGRRAGSCRANGDREQPHAQVRQPRLRTRVERGAG